MNLEEIYKIKDAKEVLKLIEEITDQSVLAALAVNNRFYKEDGFKVSWAAVKKLTDQSAIEKVARSARYDHVQTEAISRLTKQSLLSDFALNYSKASIRMAAAHRLADKALAQRVYRSIARDAEEGSFERKWAMGFLDDQSNLIEVTKEALTDLQEEKPKMSEDSNPCLSCFGWDHTAGDCYRMSCSGNSHKYGSSASRNLWPDGE